MVGIGLIQMVKCYPTMTKYLRDLKRVGPSRRFLVFCQEVRIEHRKGGTLLKRVGPEEGLGRCWSSVLGHFTS